MQLMMLQRLLLLWLLVFTADARAYIDPNAGGLLYQILFPVLVAIGAVWGWLRHRISAWWARMRSRSADKTSKPDDV